MKRLMILLVLLLLVVAPGFSQTGTFKTYTGGTQVSTETVDLVVPQQDLNAGTVDTAQLVDGSVTADKIASDSDVIINSITVADDVNTSGYSTFGEYGTGVKCQIVASLTPSLEGGETTINMDMDSSKIVGYDVIVFITADAALKEHSNIAGYSFSTNFSWTGLKVTLHATESENILSKPVVAMIWYKE